MKTPSRYTIRPDNSQSDNNWPSLQNLSWEKEIVEIFQTELASYPGTSIKLFPFVKKKEPKIYFGEKKFLLVAKKTFSFYSNVRPPKRAQTLMEMEMANKKRKNWTRNFLSQYSPPQFSALIP